MSYVWRRVLLGAVQVAALSVLAFLLLSVAPGHFYSESRLDPRRTPATVDAWVRSQRLGEPWPFRYAGWLWSCVSGDGCGVSLAYGLPVSALVGARCRPTAGIVLLSWLLGWLAGLWLAWAASVWPAWGRAAEPVLMVAAILPDVLAGSLLLWLAVAIGLPAGGVWLPVLILSAGLAAVVFLHAHRALGEAAQARFVRLARSRGLGSVLLWRRYTLLEAANPLISLLAPTLIGVTGSALAVEALTGRPGLGPLFLEAFQARDYPVVQAVLVLLGSILAIGSLLADLLLFRLDPRIRVPAEGAGS